MHADEPDPLEDEGLSSPSSPAELIQRSPGQAYIAICLIVRDQNEDLREWVMYHQAIGVEKFYIFDDNSSVPVAEEFHDLMQQGG